MTGLSTYGENQVLGAIEAASFVSLHVADPGNTGVNEVAGDPAYARQPVGGFTRTGGNPTTSTNTNAITYPAATATWGNISFYGLWSSVSAGNFLGSAAITTPKLVDIGDIARFLAGALQIVVD